MSENQNESKPEGAEQPSPEGLSSSALLAAQRRIRELEAILNTPEFYDFVKAVPLEASHQLARWGVEHDAGKEPQDWFWLIGYLSGKALRAHLDGNTEKALHHCISTAAALNNWHAQILGKSDMRPGIMPPVEAANATAQTPPNSGTKDHE